ncbi:hypothetical protein IFR05_008549 [Cadophora sp. M221]|nr:hypothetical protein IFR05_008549 [Cadophora sp. M221]
MSTPSTTNSKVPWINRQLNKIGSKLHKIHPEGKKNKVEEDSAGLPSGNDVPGREVGFNAFGDGGNGGQDLNVNGKENETRVGVVEVPTKISEEVAAKPAEEFPANIKPAEPTYTTGSGSDTVGHARTDAHIPFDDDAGKLGGNVGIEGGVTAYTALNSHPVTGPLR